MADEPAVVAGDRIDGSESRDLGRSLVHEVACLELVGLGHVRADPSRLAKRIDGIREVVRIDVRELIAASMPSVAKAALCIAGEAE